MISNRENDVTRVGVTKWMLVLLCLALTMTASPVRAQEFADPAPAPVGASDAAKTNEMAKTLANPIGNLISVPFQGNVDFGAGPSGDGVQMKINLQPIVPISLNPTWNLISRTILPIIYQDNISGTSSQFGLSDTVQSFFLSPVAPTEDGWIWGAGPVLLVPTATDDLLGTEKWGAGPTGVLLKQQNGWTYGGLFNHIWSFAGESGRANVNATYLQPFGSYTTKTATTFTLNTESTYDWNASQWTIPVNIMAQQLVKVGQQPVALTAGYRYYLDKPDGGPDWGLRFAVILLFPK
jgi:hypothetical protein